MDIDKKVDSIGKVVGQDGLEAGHYSNSYIDPEIEKKLVRKLDIRLLGTMMVLYVWNYIDRGNITYARLGTFEQDLGLKGQEYQTLIGLFFVGYITLQIPGNLVVRKVRPSLFMAIVMALWGCVSACTGAVQNFQGALACRFLLGAVEAPFFPAALYLLSSWYTKSELAARIAILFASGLMAGAFGGLLATGIMSGMDNKLDHAAWRWLFWLEGSVTVPFAIAAAFILPDYPATTKWLSEEEKTVAMLRIANQATEYDVDNDDISGESPLKTSWIAVKQAFSDPKVYLIWFMQLGLNSSAAITNFFPTIVETLGYGQTKTLLLTAPPYIFVAFLSVSNCLHSDKTGERWIHILWPQLLAIIGFAIAAGSMNTAARYVSMFLGLSVYGSFGCILSWIQTTVPHPPAKRSVAYSIVNAGSQFASIYGSYLYDSSFSPRYWQVMVANVCFCSLCALLATVLHFYLKKLNSDLNKAASEDEAEGGYSGEADNVGPRLQALSTKLGIPPAYRYLA